MLLLGTVLPRVTVCTLDPQMTPGWGTGPGRELLGTKQPLCCLKLAKITAIPDVAPGYQVQLEERMSAQSPTGQVGVLTLCCMLCSLLLNASVAVYFCLSALVCLADVPVHVVPDDGIEIVLPSFHKSPDGYLQVCWVIYS